MKVIFYSVLMNQEDKVKEIAADYGVEVTIVKSPLTAENVGLAKGFDAVSVAGKCSLNKENLLKLKEYGINHISTKTVGYENVDIESCRELGIKFSNSSYSPDSVGEFTVMSILNILRKLPVAQAKLRKKDFTIGGLQGRELHNQTVGVVGTGRIGQSVIKGLSGFGCKILGYDVYENEALKEYIDYVPFDELLMKSDVITLHVPLLKENYHMINEETIAMMKDDVCIVNNARGELVDSKALINGLNSGKIAGAALDVIENEKAIFRYDYSDKEIEDENLNTLLEMNNVQITTHHSFFTKQAEFDMINCAVKSLVEFAETGHATTEIC